MTRRVDRLRAAGARLLPAAARPAVGVLLLCALLGLTLDHTHPYQGDETYYIKSAIGMLKAGDLLVPQYDGVIRFQKPILTYWLTALGYGVFGISLWAGRVPFLLAAGLLLMLVHRFACLLFADDEAAGLAVALVSSSMLFLLFSRVSMTDLPLAVCSTAALYFLCRHELAQPRQPRDVSVAYLAMGAGVLAKGALAMLPLAAVAAWAARSDPAGARASMRRLIAPRHLVVFALVAAPWYAYAWLAWPVQFRAQAAHEAADNLGPGIAAIAGHLAFYAAAAVVYQLPAVGITAWARWKGLTPRGRTSVLAPLYWYVALYLSTAILLFTHHRDRYLLPVIPALALIMTGVIRRAGITRPARRLAAVAAVVQIAGIWVHGVAVGRPLHDLVRYWETDLRGDLAVHALEDRDAAWTLAIAHGRLASRQAGAPCIVTTADRAAELPDYEAVRRASRATGIAWVEGRPAVRRTEYVLLERRR